MLKRIPTAAACLLSSLLAATLPARAQNRLPQVIPAGSARVVLANTVNRKVDLSTDLGAADPDQQLALSLRFNMTQEQTRALEQLLANQQNPSSPSYHRWLTPQQFGAAFGLSTGDLAAVSHWLQAQGFTVTGVANGRSFISFSGSVAQAEQAFGVSIHKMTLNGEPHIANVTDPALPAAIARVATGITGLSDFRVQSRVHRRQIVASPDLATAKYDGSAAGYGNLLAPGDFYTIYDENTLLTPSTGNAVDGTGVTIAVMGQVEVDAADIASFFAASGLSSTKPFTQDSVGVTPSAPSAAACGATTPPSGCGDLYESSLDLEWSGASAPGASILFVTGPDVFANSMTQAIDQKLAPILTVSYGACEQSFNSGTPNTAMLDALFMQANAQGQTVVGPGGDTGATDCDAGMNETVATMGLAVDYPASSPYVTAVGGTQFDDANGTYWNATAGANGGTALGYIPEQPWNEFFQSFSTGVAGLTDGAGGGGISSLYAKPYWQQGPGVPSDASRDVPDVAYAAASNHDGYLFCAFGSCTNGTFGSTIAGSTNYNAAGGTSFGTPIFAGTLALVEQKIGGSIGNANPTIYGLANSTYLDSVFHIKDAGGSNAAPCSPGTIDCVAGFPNYYALGTLPCPANSCTGNTASTAIGYAAASGYVYDTATGWGSVDIANFVADWSLAVPITAVTASTDQASAVVVTTTTPSVSAGAQIAVTANVASGTGTGPTPTGAVTLLIDNVAEGPAVALAGGTANLTYTTPGSFPSGTHTVAVSYAGDAVYAGSKGATSVDVTSATGADFQLSPAGTSVTVQSGGTSSPVTFTVTSLNSFAGTVTFAAADAALTNAAYSFSVSPVTLSANGSDTTTVTFYAYYNATTGLFKGSKMKRFGGTGNAGGLLPIRPWLLGGSGAALAGLLLFGVRARRRSRWSALLVAMITIAVVSGAGCGGSSTLANGGGNGNMNAPAGTYPVSITATGTTANNVSISHSVTLNLIVQ